MPDDQLTRKAQTNGDQLAFARRLRQERTDAEKRLWLRLRNRQLGGFKFRRQQPCGPYVLDFLCHDVGLVVELDGGQHGDAENARRDAERTAYLRSHGLIVVRFWNHDVLRDTDAVCRTILRALTEPGSHEGRVTRYSG